MGEVVKVISLSRSQERRRVFSQINGHIKYEFFDAIDGFDAANQDLIVDTKIFSGNCQYSLAAKGNALSHITLWRECISSGIGVTVVEDDAIFRSDFELQREQMYYQASENWDLIVWGFNFDRMVFLNILPGVSYCAMRFSQDSLRLHSESYRKSSVKPLLMPLSHCYGTPGYSISPKGASKLLAKILPLKGSNTFMNQSFLNLGLDAAMASEYQFLESYISLPPLVVTKNDKSISTVFPSNNF